VSGGSGGRPSSFKLARQPGQKRDEERAAAASGHGRRIRSGMVKGFTITLILGALASCAAPLQFPSDCPTTVAPTFTLRPTAVPPASLSAPSASRSPTMPLRPQVSLQADLDYSAHRCTCGKRSYTQPHRRETGSPGFGRAGRAATRRADDHESERGRRLEAWGRLSGAVLLINLGRPLATGKAVVVTIEYTLDLPPIRPMPMDKRGTGVEHAPDESGRLVSGGFDIPGRMAGRAQPAHVVGETTTPEAVDITLDLGIKNAPDDLQIIASAPAESIGERLRFTLTGARSLALSLGTGFQVAEARTTSGILVHSAFFQEHAAAGQAAMQTATTALEVYEARFRPYRHPQISIVEAEFSDGMEYSGLYFWAASITQVTTARRSII